MLILVAIPLTFACMNYFGTVSLLSVHPKFGETDAFELLGLEAREDIKNDVFRQIGGNRSLSESLRAAFAVMRWHKYEKPLLTHTKDCRCTVLSFEEVAKDRSIEGSMDEFPEFIECEGHVKEECAEIPYGSAMVRPGRCISGPHWWKRVGKYADAPPKEFVLVDGRVCVLDAENDAVDCGFSCN